jgi:hypothetical protein
MHGAIGGLRLAAFVSSRPAHHLHYRLSQAWFFNATCYGSQDNNRDYDLNWRHARGDISGIMDGSIA